MIQITTDRKVASIATVNVENDKDVVKLEFTCPNQVTPQLKLTDCNKVYINYSNADVPDRYLVTDLTPGEGEQADTVTFSWLLGRNAVHSSGSTFFVICAQKLDAAGEIAQEWNTELTSFKVHRGLETLQQPVKPYEDIFSQIFSDLAKKLIVENIIAGNNVTLDVSGNNITINAEGGASVEVDNVTLENDEGTLKVKPGGIGSPQLSAAVLNLINSKATQFRTLYTPQASGVRAENIPTGVYEAAAAFKLIIGYGTTYESQININQGDSFYVAFLGSPSYVEGYVIGENLTAFLYSNSDDGVLVFTITDIPTLALALSSEVDARIAGDNNLQTQIDAITVSSDVIDVVGTYTDLQNYDTAHVKANDIIKVLQDSTHDDALSYYRWVITGGVGAWTYVGSEGPFYTKGETNQLLQAKLDANQGSINAGKFMKVGNGGEIEYEELTIPTIVQTPGDSTLNVLSQKAVDDYYAKKKAYSTTEQVIGTFTDGRPLYEKTIIIPSRSYSSGTTYVDISTELPDIEMPVFYTQQQQYLDYSTQKPMFNTNFPTLTIDNGEVKMGVYISSARSYTATVIFNIQYVKAAAS